MTAKTHTDKRRLISVLHSDLTVNTLAKQIIEDNFRMAKKRPDLIVPAKLPIPMTRHCRRRIAKYNRVHMDHEFHSLFDKAIHEIKKTVERRAT